MKDFSSVKGFIFDLDGVITDTAKFHEIAWHRVADEVGATWNQQLANGLKGVSRMDSLNEILKVAGKDGVYSRFDKEKLANQKNKQYQDLIKKIGPNDMLPGMKHFIEELRQNNYPMSIASASKNASTILNQLKITDYFRGIVDPSALHFGKPNPEIFIQAADIIGLKAEEIVSIEDAFAGIKSIKAAGQISLGIGSATLAAKPDLYFRDTSQVSLSAVAKKIDELYL
ncbi:beta-phosphoglucomutase [Oenococcus sicerae]|uniref:Beta-phosphoglucomutase n=1 Tax=Oenococcus sicerae TaxID=2203724 RepID=A0AAJ1VQH1_9LACO|nr:beta-phosphoglucomutase [Oenococcus sicerae]MDN6900187.1 beta-phosphoglucomutase [Oenococcus sicerae]